MEYDFKWMVNRQNEIILDVILPIFVNLQLF